MHNRQELLFEMLSLLLVLGSACLLFSGSSAESISSQKCKEFAKQVYKSGECNERVFLGGNEAKLGEFPYMAALRYDTNETVFLCSGALISEKYVITAAYCLNTISGKPKSVLLGQVVLDMDGVKPPQPEAQQLDIASITVHPDYNPRNKRHVIGLIELKQPVKLDRNVHPICLDDRAVTDKIAIASGWSLHSRIADTLEDLDRKGYLLKNDQMSLFELEECKTIYANKTRGGIAESNICVGDKRTKCDKQPSSTIQVASKDAACMDSLIGIVSHGPPCGGNSAPDIYTNVKSYLPWIEGIVWK